MNAHQIIALSVLALVIVIVVGITVHVNVVSLNVVKRLRIQRLLRGGRASVASLVCVELYKLGWSTNIKILARRSCFSTKELEAVITANPSLFGIDMHAYDEERTTVHLREAYHKFITDHAYGDIEDLHKQLSELLVANAVKSELTCDG